MVIVKYFLGVVYMEMELGFGMLFICSVLAEGWYQIARSGLRYLKYVWRSITFTIGIDFGN